VYKDSDKIIDITELRNKQQENVIDVTDYIEERLNKSKMKKQYKGYYQDIITSMILINQAIVYFILFYLITK